MSMRLNTHLRLFYSSSFSGTPSNDVCVGGNEHGATPSAESPNTDSGSGTADAPKEIADLLEKMEEVNK